MQHQKPKDIFKVIGAFILFMFVLPFLVRSCEEQQYKEWKDEYEEQRINNR